jgi:nitroimidazol reductase NimA-like FMN-containing flavoprotein (pyridoxamine 5'-phosphate oxidase superfamily)
MSRARDDIAAILKEGKDLTLATLMPDGSPQATVVSYASDGTTIYFGCGRDSQKAKNLSADARVAVTVTLPYQDWMQIRGVALSGRAEPVTSPDEITRAGLLFLEKFPDVAQYTQAAEIGGEEAIAFFRVQPRIASVLDYRKGFGHTEDVRFATESAAPQG